MACRLARPTETEQHGDASFSISSIQLHGPEGGSIFQNARSTRLAGTKDEGRQQQVGVKTTVIFSLFFFFFFSFSLKEFHIELLVKSCSQKSEEGNFYHEEKRRGNICVEGLYLTQGQHSACIIEV